jgi:tetratricopeptide (TPR) repeat protein
LKPCTGQNVNVRHYESLLEAELAALDGRRSIALKHYDISILLAGRQGFIQDQAMAHQKLGEFHLKSANMQDAEYHVGEAIKLYEEWGAFQKAHHIKVKHEKLLAPPSEILVAT